jgi:hypothetical protein
LPARQQTTCAEIPFLRKNNSFRPFSFVLCTLFFVLVFVLCDKYQRPFPCLSQIQVVAATKREEKRNKMMTRQKTAITLQRRKEQKTFLRQEREKKKSLITN